MHDQDRAILKALVSVAWADGKVTSDESEILEALLQAFEASPDEADAIRRYAASPRGLEDIPMTELSADDRRALVQHAVLLTFVDGEQAVAERQFLDSLCERLRIPMAESALLLSAAETRARRFLNLL